MSHVLRVLFLGAMFAFILSMQYNLEADRTANRQVKNALELAVHDAALALDEAQLAQGNIVFDQVQARDNFNQSLVNNLELKSSSNKFFEPEADSYYQDEFVLESIEFLDDSNATFPMDYNNNQYNIVERVNGPSIVAVLSTKSPRYFRGEGINIRKAVVYEYFK
ncbi:peptidase M23 [Terribacillus saccharophilus]|uniref:peptidase M23 n=1 Tax=Terribacillus saccharophilus TaxID=361277 RepID=UPI003D286765